MAVSAPANGHGATIAKLETQVYGLEVGQGDIKRTVLDLDSKIDQSIAALANRFESSINTLANKIEARNTTNWPVLISGLGAVITIVSLIGAMAFLPIQRDTARLDAAVSAVLERGVFQREYGADQTRAKEEMRDLRAVITTRITTTRYAADLERTNHALERLMSKAEAEATFRERQKQIEANSANIDNLRIRTYDHFGRINKTEQAIADLERRFDAVSRRLAEYIRDNGRRPQAN